MSGAGASIATAPSTVGRVTLAVGRPRRGTGRPYWLSWPLAAPWGYVALCTLT